VGDTSDRDAQKLALKLHHLQVNNELLTGENEGLRGALAVKKKHKKHGKVPDLQQREEYHGGAVFWSPRNNREANARGAVKQQEQHEDTRRCSAAGPVCVRGCPALWSRQPVI
jgi:hypothetical protein